MRHYQTCRAERLYANRSDRQARAAKESPNAGRAGIKQATWLPPQGAEARRQFGGLKPEEADSYRCLFIKSLQVGVNGLENKLLLSGWQFLNFIHSTL